MELTRESLRAMNFYDYKSNLTSKESYERLMEALGDKATTIELPLVEDGAALVEGGAMIARVGVVLGLNAYNFRGRVAAFRARKSNRLRLRS
ncbi:hypothetical protein LAZ67_11001156 [Cordylochernes scorpioides]|uniref:Uncharacterized protein n=1 Tax=Cordylochernes scorpioides TaxID=51811 RepID=A0ABY6L360_9ARAC|nr:hypothetical protein LAZ67_11001156 [Cordylochernes scorpioides]